MSLHTLCSNKKKKGKRERKKKKTPLYKDSRTLINFFLA